VETPGPFFVFDGDGATEKNSAKRSLRSQRSPGRRS